MSDSDRNEVRIRHGMRVATEAMWARRDRLLEIQGWLQDAILLIKTLVASADSARAIATLRELRALRDEVAGLVGALERAIDCYTEAERRASALARESVANASYLLGFALGPLGTSALLLATADRAISAEGAELERLAGTSPYLLDSVDNLLAGALRLPAGDADAADSAAALLLGPRAVAARIAALRRTGAGGLRLDAGDRFAVTPPGGFAEGFARVPTGQHQFRLEQYQAAAGPSWIGYVGGTRSASLGGGEPFDMQSNLENVAGADSASVDALAAGLRQQGYRYPDPIVLFGHSQGAASAVALANEGRFNVVLVVSAGGPLGAAPPQVRVLDVRFDNDAIATLAGEVEPSPLHTSVILPGEPAESVEAAHSLERYAARAAELDGLDSAAVRQLSGQLANLAPAGTAGAARTWWAKREPAGAAAAEQPRANGARRSPAALRDAGRTSPE